MVYTEFKNVCVRFVLSIAMLLTFFLPSQVSAQVVGATISGTVTDSSGSKMPDVEIAITNVGTGIVTNTTTKGEGTFVVPNLQPGNYEISASAKGFSTLVRKGITLTVGQELILNLSMQVGGVSETVTVTAEAPTVNLANATISGVIEAEGGERTSTQRPIVDGSGDLAARRACSLRTSLRSMQGTE